VYCAPGRATTRAIGKAKINSEMAEKNVSQYLSDKVIKLAIFMFFIVNI
jgi:hypothetical protein